MIDYLGFGYALMVAGGGVMGYVKSQSVPSLAAGLLFGGVIGFGAYQVSANNKVYVSLASSAVLGGMMGWRFYGSGKIMPAGFIAAMSFLFVIYYIVLGVLFYKGILGDSPYQSAPEDYTAAPTVKATEGLAENEMAADLIQKGTTSLPV